MAIKKDDIEFRPARLDDSKEIVKLWQDFMKEHDKGVVKSNPDLAPHMAKLADAHRLFHDFLKKRIRSKYSTVNVATHSGKIVGYSLIQIKKTAPIFRIKETGHFADIYVQKRYRKLGISSKFRDLGISWFRSKKIKTVSLTVYPDNPHAHAIYRRWGFTDYHTSMRMKI